MGTLLNTSFRHFSPLFVFYRELAVRLQKSLSLLFRSEPQAHQTRGGVTARAVFFPLPPQRFARICCRASRKKAYFRFALSRKSHRTRGGVTARAANLLLYLKHRAR